MVDIPKLIEMKRKEQLLEYTAQLRLLIAANNRQMETDDFKELVRDLTKNLESSETNQSDKLDRHALEALRLMTNQGANKTGGR